MKAKLGPRCDQLFQVFEALDPALEYCEDRLLERLLEPLSEMSIGVANYELFARFNADELAIVRKLLERRNFKPGEEIIQIGAPATELFLLARGSVSVIVPLGDGGRKRLASLTAGMSFGEMAVLDHAPEARRFSRMDPWLATFSPLPTSTVSR
jgi:glutaminase